MFEFLFNFLIFCYINFVDLTILHILIVSLSHSLSLSHTHIYINDFKLYSIFNPESKLYQIILYHIILYYI